MRFAYVVFVSQSKSFDGSVVFFRSFTDRHNLGEVCIARIAGLTPILRSAIDRDIDGNSVAYTGTTIQWRQRDGGSHATITDENDLELKYTMSIFADDGGFEEISGEAVTSYLRLHALPQITGFLIGRFGFNSNETERLGRAYDKITSDKCRKFFDDTLAALRQKGEIQSGFQTTPTTLAWALSITHINKYSSHLTARDVGVSQRSWANVKDKFDNPQGFGTHASGVTLADGRIFLTDNAFYQAGAISQLLYKDTDLPGVIVHELFHRAGLSESQIRALHPDIQRNCGNPKDAL